MSPATLMHKRLFNFRRERFIPIEYPLGISSSDLGRKMKAHIEEMERDGTYDAIEDELFRNLREKKKNISDFARKTDQAKTPIEFWNILLERNFITRSQFVDCCLLFPNWNDKEFYNALKEIAPGTKIYMNAPFSECSTFWLWMLLMHGRHGVSFSCIAPHESYSDNTLAPYLPDFV
jgi:hypothetical protein